MEEKGAYGLSDWRVIAMTLQQQAFQKIEQLPDDTVRVLIELIDKMIVVNKPTATLSVVETKTTDSAKAADDSDGRWRTLLFDSIGKVEVDEDAYWNLREKSMI